MLNILQNTKTQLKDGGADALVWSFSLERWTAKTASSNLGHPASWN
jgi:hypothetical protein